MSRKITLLMIIPLSARSGGEQSQIDFKHVLLHHFEYSGLLTEKKALKSEVEVKYENYKFFTVDVDHEIIKKKIEALFSTRSRLTLKNAMRSLPCIIRYF